MPASQIGILLLAEKKKYYQKKFVFYLDIIKIVLITAQYFNGHLDSKFDKNYIFSFGYQAIIPNPTPLRMCPKSKQQMLQTGKW